MFPQIKDEERKFEKEDYVDLGLTLFVITLLFIGMTKVLIFGS